MKKKSLLMISIGILLAAVVGGWILVGPKGIAGGASAFSISGLAAAKAASNALTPSGFIEAETVRVSAEIPGRIERLWINEGESVAENQLLVEIDSALLDAQIIEAEAAFTLAEAQLARVEAGARSEEIAIVAAAVSMAEAQKEAAYQTWQDTILLRDNPQELDLQIAAARTQLAVAEPRIAQMTALKDAGELVSGLRERQVSQAEEGFDYRITIPGYGTISGRADTPEGEKRLAWAGWNLAGTDVWSAWAGLNGTIAARDAAQQGLNDLLVLRHNPQQFEIRVTQAEAAYRQTGADAQAARANLDLAEAGATAEQIDLARTGVTQAQAALDALNVQRQKFTLYAPAGGMVLERTAREGETVLPGSPLLILGNLDVVNLVVYVPAQEAGQVSLGQSVAVTVDSFPGETFPGQVVWISDEAEFTPMNVQTKEERARTVFAVKIGIPNPDWKLKPGMPADATINNE